ncbi:MAG: multifunctional CCA addition/repair protein [Steroidobacteraceae bacterium]
MKIFLVGGAVRDRLLGLTPHERDWVVVGGTPDDLAALGYRPVGKDFPVFLHPATGEQYALARTERKTGPGYYGFETRFSPDVTLEEDLARRDLTVNAMAEDDDGRLVDPYGGQRDLEARVLRHVSAAFVEDPLRVLRVARFAARYARLGFEVAAETLDLMKRIAASGELAALAPERVWTETERALGEPAPGVYFSVLHRCGALGALFPEIAALDGVPQPPKWHPEVDTYVHTLEVLDVATALTPDTTVRWASLVHDVGKGTTPREEWPRHIGHEERGVALIQAMSTRLRVPNEHRELAVLAARLHGRVHRSTEMRPGTLLELLEAADAFRRVERFERLLLACEADARGRGAELRERPYPQAALLRRVREAAAAARLDPGHAGDAGPVIAERIRAARIDAIRSALEG